ncbi:MAG: GTPase ObgE, partial [Muribaculaceae bacterium]|nr:GTPase ObgE [Muribaculaceae bacterium]
ADDIAGEYKLLLNELQQFNPQLMDKQRVLAVSKCDMLDEELIDEIRDTLPEDVNIVFISAVSGFGLTELKDTLWRSINDENNRITTIDIVQRPLDAQHRVSEEDDFIFKYEPTEEELEEAEDMQSINPEAWADDIGYDWDEDLDPED